MKRCVICNKEHNGKGQTCSASCRVTLQQLNRSGKSIEQYKKEKSEIKFCKICGKQLEDSRQGQTCSNECRSKLIGESYKSRTSDQNHESKIKRDKTCIEKYGNVVDFSTHNNGKIDETNKEQIVQKIKETCLEKYGAEWVTKSEKVKNKISDTLKNTFSNKDEQFWKDRKNKYENTMKEKYGYKNSFLSENSKKTMEERYGGRYTLQSPVLKKKYSETCFRRYGVLHYFPEKFTFKTISKINKSFSNVLNENKINNEMEFRIDNKFYDIKVNNFLVEINPWFTHNSTDKIFGRDPIDKNYHLNKSKLAEENGYHCIHVFDWDDWDKVIDLINPNKVKIYARKCKIKEIDKSECNSFEVKYHLQGYCNKQLIRLGLFYNDELVQLMTFGKPRYNKNYQYELLRLCSKSGYSIIGGSEKLFKYFITNYNPISIISYCDRSKFTGEVYKKLKMKLISTSSPSCHWFNKKTNEHITDNLLRQRGFDQLFGTNYGKGTNNEELMIENNFVKIYDCGQATFIWKTEN